MGYIYKITNTVNGKSYIGQTINKPEYRINNHFNLNDKGCVAIHNAIRKYGRDAFTLEILHEALDIFLDDLEIAEINKHNTLAPNGYNIEGGGNANKVLSDQTRQKMSESRKGRKVTLETRKKLSEANRGKKHTLETRKKLSEAHKGKTLSLEHRQKLSEAHKGKTLSFEHRQKMSEAHKGRTLSPEHRQKLSEANAHPERAAAYEILHALPEDMSLAERRKHLRNKFPERSESAVRLWVKKWSETSL